MIRFDKFTQKAQDAAQGAQSIAAEHGHQQVQPLHLLIALSEESEGVVAAVFDKCGIQRQVVAEDARKVLPDIPQVQGTQGGTHLSPALNSVLENAFKVTERFKDEYVSTEHLLLALAESKGDPAGRLLNQVGATHDAILHALQ